MGADYLGLGGLFSSILNVLSLAELGFSTAIVYNMYKPIAEGDTDTICALMAFFRRVYRIIGIVVLVVGLTVIPLLPYLIHGAYPEGMNIQVLYVLYLANSAVSYFLFAYRNCLLIAHQREDVSSKVNIAVKVPMYMLQCVALIMFRNYYVFVALLILATITINVTTALLSRKYYPQYCCAGNLGEAQREGIRKNVGGLVIGKLCLVSRNAFDSIVISLYLGLSSVAIYDNYYYILNAVNGMLVMVMVSISAGVGDSIAAETEEKNYSDFKMISFVYSWISGWFCICLLSLYQPFMTLWMGHDMLLSNFNVVLLCVYFYSLTMGDVRSQYSSSAGLFWENRKYVLVEALVNLTLNFVLGRFFGISGVIAATIISIVLINFFWGSAILFKHYFVHQRIGDFYKMQARGCMATIAASLPSLVLLTQLTAPPLIALLINGFVSLTVPNIIFYIIYRKTSVFQESKQFIRRCLRAAR